MAESATENTPYKKRKLTFTENTCCFCQKKIKQNKVTLKPSKLDSLLSVCLTKNDEISTNILGNQDKIRNGELQIVYHKTCRTKFVHPFYNSKTEEDDNPRSTPSKLTRSQSKPKEFDWKEMCFICGEKCSSKHRNKWSKVEGSIDENSKLYSKLLKVSAEKGDQILHSRLLSSNGDLVAVEARYHRKKHCLATYLLYDDTNVQSESELDMICKSLKSEITDEVENRKRVYDLSQIRSQVQELGKLKNLKIEKLTNKQTKRALKRVWPTLRFIHRTGLSDLVCSNTLSIDDALCNFVRLEKQLETVEEQNDLDLSLAENFERSESHELSVIREAAMVIRNRLLNAKTITNEYFSSQEITAEAQKQFLDKHLLLFVKWLSVDTDETNTDEIAFTQQELSVCSDIAYLVKPTTTPKHLGLSVYLHHSYGSKKLIEDLHAHGYTWSYTEVRHFLTSAALHMSSAQDQTPSGRVIC